MSYFEFPHTRTYDGDLGYIIKCLNDLNNKYEEYFKYNSIAFADPIQWNISSQYEAFTIVSDTNTNGSYMSKKPVPIGIDILNNEYWEFIGLFQVDSFLSVTSVNPISNKPVAIRFNELRDELLEIHNSINGLNNDLNLETFQRTAGDVELTGRIDTLDHDLMVESAQREGEDSTINARIDNLIIADPGDAELSDIRVGYNGITYSTAGDAVRGQAGDLNKYNVSNVLVGQISHVNSTEHQVTYTWSGDTCTVNGTADGTSAKVLRVSSALPFGMFPGNTYYVRYKTTDPKVKLRLIFRDSSDSTLSTLYAIGNRSIDVPEDASKLTIALYISSGDTINNAVVSEIAILSEKTNTDIYNELYPAMFKSNGIIPDNTDLDNVKTIGSYIMQSGYTYAHTPFSGTFAGTLIVYPSTTNTILQIVIAAGETNKLFNRTSILGSFPATWNQVNSGTVNQYITQNYENTYNIACSPEITTDTNNYLPATGDNTDRTAEIQTMLNNGICLLGPGTFYVSGVEVPNYSALKGCGSRTVIKLIDSVTTGFAVKLKNLGSVSDLRIVGGESAPEISSSLGGRNGIIFEGTRTPNDATGTTYKRSLINNVTVLYFNGSGIYCTKTGTPIDSNLLINNTFVYSCNAGINIEFYSEYHRICNSSFQYCYYGCIDNGGNNNFSNCDFSANRIGIYIDNSTDQSTNNSHGTFSSCSVNHSISDAGVANKGIAIKLVKSDLGEIFTGSQIFYGKIIIDECVGVRFIGSNIGSDVPITITDSTVVTFSDSTFKEAPDSATSPATLSGNTTVVFDNCYLRSGITYDPTT